VKITTPRDCIGFARKEEFRVRENSLYGTLSKSDKPTSIKLKRVTRSSQDQLPVKAAGKSPGSFTSLFFTISIWVRLTISVSIKSRETKGPGTWPLINCTVYCNRPRL